VANVLVVIEVAGAHVRPVCLETLGQARRIGTHLGATVYAVVPLPRAPKFAEDDLIAVLSKHGADKVVLVTDEGLESGAAAMRWGTHGVAISAASDLLPPSLLLFGATAGAREVAARAAARLGAAYLPDAWLEMENERLVAWRGSGDKAARLEGELEFPVVATIPPGRYSAAEGDDEAEVEVIAASGRTPDFEDVAADGDAPRALVLCGDGPERASAAALAISLGGEVRQSVAAPERTEAPLVVSLGPPVNGIVAETRVALGASIGGVDYVVDGDPAELARDLARSLGKEVE
jgi:electron transfer flavoprotein alpha subunit